MEYPTMHQVEKADRAQIYRWFMCLPMPRMIREDKGKKAQWIDYPGGESRAIIARIFERWKELGGHDQAILNQICKEVMP